MPIEDLLSTTGVPVKFHVMPEGVDALDQTFLGLGVTVEVLTHTQESLHQETTLDKVAAIILLAKRFHLARRTIEPVGPYPMETVGFLKEGQDAIQALNALLTGNETAVHSDHESRDAKTATTRCDNILVIFRILAVKMNALTRKT